MSTIYSFLNDNNNRRKIITIKKVNDFFNLALKLMENDTLIYRGINSNNQKYPKLIRNKDYSKYEAGFLQEFEKYYGLYSRVPNFWEFIALAQHHGLKTRLIDFTNNIFVAAFFSLHNKSKTGEYKIYIFNRQEFRDFSEWNKENGYVSEPDEKMADNVMIAFSHFETTGSDYILTPNYSNNRMFIQQGLFVIPGISTPKHIDELYNNSFVEININPKIRKYLLNKLKRFGYDEYRLMPDLDSLCCEINNCFNNK